MRFAFVVLVACSPGTPREHSQHPPLAVTPIDEPADAAVDASAVVYGACDWNRPDPKNPRCAPENMPLMRCRDVNGPNARFPKCIEDKKVVEVAKPIVLAIRRRGEVTDHGTSILVEGGTNRGIDKSRAVVVLDAKQRPLRGGEASFVRLDPDEIEIVARLTADQIDTLARAVQFTPPR
jgi:hypothetical protein